MNENIKRYVLIPIILVLLSGVLIWVTGAWKLLKWVPWEESGFKIIEIMKNAVVESEEHWSYGELFSGRNWKTEGKIGGIR